MPSKSGLYPLHRDLKRFTGLSLGVCARCIAKLTSQAKFGCAHKVDVCSSDDFSRSTSSGGTVPCQKGIQLVRMRISPQGSARTPAKYLSPGSSWARLHVDNLLVLLRHPSMVCHSVKVLAIVILGLSPPLRLSLCNVRLSHHVRTHQSRELSSRALEWLFGCSSTCHQCGVIAICDEDMGTTRKRLKLLSPQFGSPYPNRCISPKSAVGPKQVYIF